MLPAVFGEFRIGDIELYVGSSSAERHAYVWRRAFRRGAVSGLKAPGFKPERRQAQLGGTPARTGQWSERRRAVGAGEMR